MALRSSWEGYLRLSLISIPVKAYLATVAGKGRITFHQIHVSCGHRIHYQKVCSIHGEVTKEEIASGYEIARDEYVILDPKDLNKLKADADKAIDIDVFISPEALDPMLLGERSYYLLPDGKSGEKPYAVLQQVMSDQERFAVATMVFSGREQLVLVRPLDRLLTVTLLNYEEQIKHSSEFEAELADVKVGGEELKLAETLVQASTADQFDFSNYRDEYSEKLMKLIEAKSKGKKPKVAGRHEAPAVLNLMDALRQSLSKANHKSTIAAKPRKQTRHKSAKSSSRRKTG